MEEVTTLFDSDEAEYEYMKEQETKRQKAEKEYIERGALMRHKRYISLDRYETECVIDIDKVIEAPAADVAPRAEIAEKIFAEIRLCWARRLFDCDDFSFKDFAFDDFAGDLDEIYKKYTGVPDTNVGHKTEEEAHNG